MLLVRRTMNDDERHLVGASAKAFDGDVENGMKEFETYY
jgi:hypothetical protein